MKEEKNVKKGTKIFSKFLTVIIVFLVIVCLVLFYKTVTNSEVSIFGVKLYYVLTESMSPTIEPDSLVVVKYVDPDTLKEGDIISFISRDPGIYGMVNTHRIVEIIEENGYREFVTMGDNNPAPDSIHVYPDEITGKVIFHTLPLKAVTDVLSFAGTPTGFVVIIIMPLILVLSMILKSFFRAFSKSLKEAEQEESRLIKEQHKQTENQDKEKAAAAVLELYFGKNLNELTEADIEEKLKDLK